MKKILGITAIALSAIMLSCQLPSRPPQSPSSGGFDYRVKPHSHRTEPQHHHSGLGSILLQPKPRVINLLLTQLHSCAYNSPLPLTATGQTILIVDAFGSPTVQNDLTSSTVPLALQRRPPLQSYCPTGGCPAFAPSNTFHDEIGWSIETSLDVEYAHANAPGANIVLVVASTSSGNAINVCRSKRHQPLSRQYNLSELRNPRVPSPQQQRADPSGRQQLSDRRRGKDNSLCLRGRFLAPLTALPLPTVSSPLLTPSSLLLPDPKGCRTLPLEHTSAVQQEPHAPQASPHSQGPCGVGPRPGFPGCAPQATELNRFGMNRSSAQRQVELPACFLAHLRTRAALAHIQGAADVDYNAAINGGVLVYWNGSRLEDIGSSSEEPVLARLNGQQLRLSPTKRLDDLSASSTPPSTR